MIANLLAYLYKTKTQILLKRIEIQKPLRIIGKAFACKCYLSENLIAKRAVSGTLGF